MKSIAFKSAFMMALTISSCAWWDRIDPAFPLTPTADWPCGVHRQCCTEKDDAGTYTKTGGSCSNTEICGGGAFNGCFAGECCPGGGNFGAHTKQLMGPPPDAGGR